MGAPVSVVAAVQEAFGCEERGGKHRYCYWHGGTEGVWTERGCAVAAKAADAAWAAAYPEALRDAADRLDALTALFKDGSKAYATAGTLRRWADESEAAK